MPFYLMKTWIKRHANKNPGKLWCVYLKLYMNMRKINAKAINKNWRKIDREVLTKPMVQYHHLPVWLSNIVDVKNVHIRKLWELRWRKLHDFIEQSLNSLKVIKEAEIIKKKLQKRSKQRKEFNGWNEKEMDEKKIEKWRSLKDKREAMSRKIGKMFLLRSGFLSQLKSLS